MFVLYLSGLLIWWLKSGEGEDWLVGKPAITCFTAVSLHGPTVAFFIMMYLRPFLYQLSL